MKAAFFGGCSRFAFPAASASSSSSAVSLPSSCTYCYHTIATSRFRPLSVCCSSQPHASGGGGASSIATSTPVTRDRSRDRSSSGSTSNDADPPPTGQSPKPPNVAVRRSRRKRRHKGDDVGECVPSAEDASISVRTLYQNGDPLGRKELGKCVVRWICQGMRAMASDLASAELQGEHPIEEEIRQRLGLARVNGSGGALAGGTTGGLAFVIQAQPYLYAVPMPKGLEALCFKACTHYPTLFDHFQRELRDVLQEFQRQGVITDWRATQSWKLLKEFAASDQHRAVVRKVPQSKPVHGGLGMDLEKAKVIQGKIDDFVNHMSELLRIECDAQLEFTQEALNVISIPGENSDISKPIEYLVNHAQAQQEQCDTTCNLIAINSSTVIFSREALEGGLGVSLLERTSAMHGGALATKLTIQDWMNDAIASWASKQMYDGSLQSSPAMATHRLVDSPFVENIFFYQWLESSLKLGERKTMDSCSLKIAFECGHESNKPAISARSKCYMALTYAVISQENRGTRISPEGSNLRHKEIPKDGEKTRDQGHSIAELEHKHNVLYSGDEMQTCKEDTIDQTVN